MDFSLKSLLNRRQVHDLTHERKFSCNPSDLVPIMCEDVLPGDTFSNKTELLVRLAPLLAPVMHRVNVYTHFFFVPNRIIWTFHDRVSEVDVTDGDNHSGWEMFITGYNEAGAYKPVGGGVDDAIPRCEPYIKVSKAESVQGSLFDYLYSLPEIWIDPSTEGGVVRQHVLSALPLRAYGEIWNEWYRDEDLQDKVPVKHWTREAISPSTNPITDYAYLDDLTSRVILKRGWEKDYFTSCRPWAQKGVAIKMPFVGDAPVKWKNVSANAFVRKSDGTVIDDSTASFLMSAGVDDVQSTGTMVADTSTFQKTPVSLDPNGTLYADLAQVTATTINDLRMSFQLQKFLERASRAGGRYIETILAHFGVHVPDARLRRPEYLGGGKSPIVFSEVLQTSATPVSGLRGGSDDTPLGEIAGHGFSAMKQHTFKKTFSEHGWIIGLLSIMPRTAYQQGVARRFTRPDRWAYYWPEFAHLGEQGVLEKELFAAGTPVSGTLHQEDNVVFGYQGRYDEYRFRESSVHGDFKTTLNYWHMGRIFTQNPNYTGAPALNANFIQMTNSEFDRSFAIKYDSSHCFWIQLINKLFAVRPIPKRNNPGLIDHF